MRRLPALRIVGCGGGVQSVPGIVGSVVGRRPNTGVRLGHLINQNSHVIRVPELSAAPPKRCNSNDAISMFEIHVGELRATFLGNHNMRRHKDPTRKTAQAQKTEDPQAQKTPATPTAATTATSTGALHPIRDTAPVTWRCTRYVAVHPLRGGAPVTWRCTRYVAVHPNRRGALPTDRVHCPNEQEQTRNWHTKPLTATPLHAQLGPTGGRMSTPPTPPTPPPALQPTPTPPTPLHAKSPITYPHTTTHKRDRGRRINAATRRPARPQIRRSRSLRPAALSLMNLRSTK